VSDDLLNSMHPEPIAAIDERVSPGILLDEWLIKVRFVGEIQLSYTSFGDDTAVVCLAPCQKILP
jgi:hypothetical protein